MKSSGTPSRGVVHALSSALAVLASSVPKSTMPTASAFSGIQARRILSLLPFSLRTVSWQTSRFFACQPYFLYMGAPFCSSCRDAR